MTTWLSWTIFIAIIAIAVVTIAIGAIDYVRKH